MTNRELNELLQQGKVPQPSREYSDDFAASVTRGIRQPRTAAGAAQHSSIRVRTALRWAMLLALGCIAIGFLIGRRQYSAITQERDIAEARTLAAEVAALFPNQLQSIVIRNGRPQLVLADTASVPVSPPIFLRVCSRTGCDRIITFSGQQIQINGRACDVLVNATGEIILAGDGFAWSSTGENARRGDLRITARALEGAL